MADLKISELSAAAALAGTEELPVTQSAATVRATAAAVAALAAANSADVLVRTTNANLSAERVVTDSATVIADWSTAGQVKFNVVGQPQVVNVPVDFKDSVALATTANVTLSGEQTIDGVLTSATRILVKNQTTGSQNGIYVTGAGAWTRATDADADAEVTTGMLVYVEAGGTVTGDSLWVLTTTGTITVGTTALTFAQVNIPFNVFVGKTVSGTSYTGILTDGGKRLNLTNAAAKTVTIPPQTGGGGVAYPVNTEIEVFNAGAGLATIAPGSGVTLNSYGGLLTLGQYQVAKIKKRANPNTWDVTISSAESGTIALTDGANIAVNAALGNNFRVVLGGNRTLDNPTGMRQGQVINIRINQDGTGSRTLAFGTAYHFPGGTDPTLSTAANARDFMSCQYDATDASWNCVMSKAFA